MTDDPITAALYPPDYEPVPTVVELAARHLAAVQTNPASTKSEPPRYRITPEGEAILRDTMRRNAERTKAWLARKENR